MSEYIFNEIKCESGCKFLWQTFKELLYSPIWVWKRVGPFRGEIVSVKIEPYLDTHNWNAMALLVKNGKGKESWYNCSVYPHCRLKKGDKVSRKLFGKIWKHTSSGKELLITI